MTMIDKNNDADIKGKYERGVARRKSVQQRVYDKKRLIMLSIIKRYIDMKLLYS